MNATTARAGWVLAAATGLLGVAGGRAPAFAADGQWRAQVSEASWGTAANWLNGTAADGSGSTADFNHVDITADTTVHLDSVRTIGCLIFGDISSSNGWILDNKGNPANVLTLAVGSGSPTITVNALAAGKSVEISAVLTGNQGLTNAGSGMLILSGANTYSGVTTLSAGTANLGVAETVGTSGPLGNSAADIPGSIVLVGGCLQYSTANQNDYSGRFSTAAGQQYNVDTNGQIVTWATPLTSSGGSLTKSGGTGALILTGANTYSGTTRVSAGTLQLGDYTVGHDGSIAGDIVNNAALSYHLAGTQAYAGVISGSGSLEKLGNGTLILSGGNSYSGLTNITAGVVNIQNNTALGAPGGSLVAPDTTVSSGAALQIQGGITVGSEWLALNGAGINSDGALRNVSGNNTWQGTVRVNSDTRINSDSGSLTFNTAATSITAGNKGVTLGGEGNGFVGGIISGTGASLTKDGTGTWALAGGNTYTGSTKINSGTLQFAKTTSLYGGTTSSWTATKLTVASGATVAFSVGGNNEFTTGNVTTLLTNLGGLGGAVSNNGLMAGSSIGFDTTNAVGGSFTVADKIANSTSTGGGAVGVTKLGTNTLILSGDNTYTGATSVKAGTLLVNGSLASGSAVTVAGGARLGGTNGTVLGSVTVAGTIAPGSGNSTSKLTTGAETWTGTGAYAVDINNATGTAGSVSGWDSLVMNSLTQSDGFRVNLLSSGGPASFNATSIYEWVIAEVKAGSFDTHLLRLDTTGFTGQVNGLFSLATTTRTGGGENLVLRYTYSAVPEATTLFLGMVGLAPVLLQRRRRAGVARPAAGRLSVR